MTVAVHEHGPGGALLAAFVTANTVIALGYGVLCVAWLRLLKYVQTPRSRWGMACTAAFFLGCVGTHVMAICDPHPTVFWVVWHVVQAAGTWGAIIIGRLVLADARDRWHEWEQATGPAGGDGDDESAAP